MAKTATKARSKTARPTAGQAKAAAKRRAAASQRNGSGSKRVARKAKEGVKSGTRNVGKAIEPGRGSVGGKIAGLAAKKALKALARRTVRAGARAVRAATEKSTELGKSAVESGLSKRLPIQVSIDVAVPVEVAWEEWLGGGSLPEGVHRIEDIERDGSDLIGTVAGPRSVPWEAEILDERPSESFAWRSHQGSDVAGLVTFHRLSDRLTRIELDLDVLPTNPAEAFSLSTHVAHHRAEADLRRFKARVEFISPDVYESNDNKNGAAPDQERES
jgi:uncharacterized membrane protein